MEMTKQCMLLQTRHPLAQAHFANHPAAGTQPSVMVAAYDFGLQQGTHSVQTAGRPLLSAQPLCWTVHQLGFLFIMTSQPPCMLCLKPVAYMRKMYTSGKEPVQQLLQYYPNQTQHVKANEQLPVLDAMLEACVAV